MEPIRRHFFSRFLCGLVALIILNISVDAPDIQPEYVPEDLSYNEIESIVEWVFESVMGIENAIPEHDDNDDAKPLKLDKQFELFFEYCPVAASPSPAPDIFDESLRFHVENRLSLCVIEELNEPPEV